MKFKALFTALGLCSGLFLTACSSHYVASTPSVEVKSALKPIIIQGALPVESEQMASKLSDVSVETIGGGNSGKARIMAIQSLFQKRVWA